MTSPRRRITKRLVDSLPVGSAVWDSEVKGFGVRRQKTSKVYVLKTRINGRQRWITIGDHGTPWTPESARKEAQRIWGEIRSGIDIARLRDTNKDHFRISDLCARYLTEHAEQHKKPSSVRMDRRNIVNHIAPLLGHLNVKDVTEIDIDRFKRAVKEGVTAKKPKSKRSTPYHGGAVVTGGSGAANRCLALLSKMFNLAERWSLRPRNFNPVRHVEKYQEGKKERYLSAVEFERLANVLSKRQREGIEGPYAVAAIRLLALTGARLNEILTLRWDCVDFERQTLWLPDSKSGRKPIFLSQPAIEVLANLPRFDGNPFVIVGKKQGEHLKNLQKPWGRIRKAAGLHDVRIHDLRHSYASIAAAAGLSLPVIGRLLGHTKSVTTERYAHLAAEPLRAANEAVGERIAKLMSSSATRAD
jgi:integrase